MRFLWLLLLAVTLASCGSGSGKVVRIAIDPTWYPLNFGAQQPYVNGFVDELLLEMAQYSNLTFEKIPASGNSLYEGLRAGRYDAVLSSLEPYIFNTAKYDFSHNILKLGPVLIGKSPLHLEKMQGSIIGLVAGDPARVVLEKNPTLILRSYESVPDLLNAVARGDIEAAVLDPVLANRYVEDLYAGVLQIASPPLTASGLHMVAMKDSPVVPAFDKALQRIEKKKRLSALLKKWQLN